MARDLGLSLPEPTLPERALPEPALPEPTTLAACQKIFGKTSATMRRGAVSASWPTRESPIRAEVSGDMTGSHRRQTSRLRQLWTQYGLSLPRLPGTSLPGTSPALSTPRDAEGEPFGRRPLELDAESHAQRDRPQRGLVREQKHASRGARKRSHQAVHDAHPRCQRHLQGAGRSPHQIDHHERQALGFDEAQADAHDVLGAWPDHQEVRQEDSRSSHTGGIERTRWVHEGAPRRLS